MSAASIAGRTGDAGEWALAFSLSVVLNLLAALGFAGLAEVVRPVQAPERPAEANESVAVIHPDSLQVVKESAAAAKAEAASPQEERPRGFARTSPAQDATPPERARYLGERDTRGTSELDPVPGAVEVPSQAGVDPRHEGDIETTESRYQDGTLDHDRLVKKDEAPGSAASTPASEAATDPPDSPEDFAPAERPMTAAEDSPPKTQAAPKKEEPSDLGEEAPPPEATKLLEGPQAVERPPLADEAASGAPKDRPVERSAEDKDKDKDKKDGSDLAVRKQARSSADPKEPGFRGFQQKTRLQGSISRRGVAALDVADSALGRYHAEVGRAVEREWQRNCVRYRDHITPGWITVRFVITERGEVRSIGFVEAVEVGEIQKGFTLSSIRHAPLPKMPESVKRELDGEPLELIYNFYF